MKALQDEAARDGHPKPPLEVVLEGLRFAVPSEFISVDELREKAVPYLRETVPAIAGEPI